MGGWELAQSNADRIKELEKENELLRSRCKRLAAAAHNFRVESSGWLHHRSSMLQATITDLDYELKDFDELHKNWREATGEGG